MPKYKQETIENAKYWLKQQTLLKQYLLATKYKTSCPIPDKDVVRIFLKEQNN